jgi:hypothetical protein
MRHRALDEWSRNRRIEGDTVMFTFLKALVADLWSGRDDERRHETSVQDKVRMLEMDEPMAAAGAELAGEHEKSETELALERATSRE